MPQWVREWRLMYRYTPVRGPSLRTIREFPKKLSSPFSKNAGESDHLQSQDRRNDRSPPKDFYDSSRRHRTLRWLHAIDRRIALALAVRRSLSGAIGFRGRRAIDDETVPKRFLGQTDGDRMAPLLCGFGSERGLLPNGWDQRDQRCFG